jgi:hypothetical protein
MARSVRVGACKAHVSMTKREMNELVTREWASGATGGCDMEKATRGEWEPIKISYQELSLCLTTDPMHFSSNSVTTT